MTGARIYLEATGGLGAQGVKSTLVTVAIATQLHQLLTPCGGVAMPIAPNCQRLSGAQGLHALVRVKGLFHCHAYNACFRF